MAVFIKAKIHCLAYEGNGFFMSKNETLKKEHLCM